MNCENNLDALLEHYLDQTGSPLFFRVDLRNSDTPFFLSFN